MIEVLFSAFPASSYLTSILSAIFNTVNNSDTAEAGHTRALDTCLCYRIRREASVSLNGNRSRPQLVQSWRNCTQSGYSSCQSLLLALYQQLHQAAFVKSGVQSRVQGPICSYAARGMSLLETSSLKLCWKAAILYERHR